MSRLITHTKDEMARLVIPSMPPLRPNVPIAFHLRHIRSLVSADKSGEQYFHTYTSIIQAARYSEQEPTEEEYEAALMSFNATQRMSVLLLAFKHGLI